MSTRNKRRTALKAHMRSSGLRLLLLAASVSTAACILRPGMNAECRWPPEPPRALDLSALADRRHLVVDAELIEELVDRYRFHPLEQQRQCEHRLAAVVAGLHAVDLGDVERARVEIPRRGLDLPVTVPVAVMFAWSVLQILRRIERRFADEPVPLAVTLIVASIAVSGVFVWVGEMWTSILQMIRVGSQHVGGRVNRLMWPQHERLIFVIGIALFWTIVVVRTITRALRQSRPTTRGDSLAKNKI